MSSPTPIVIRFQTPVPVTVHGQVPVTVHGQVPVTTSTALPVQIQNPDYVADAAAVFVAVLALVALLVSFRQLGLAKVQTIDAEKAASESTDAKNLMEQSVEYMRQQMDLLSRTAHLSLTFHDGKTHFKAAWSKKVRREGTVVDGWARINLIFYLHNDGTRSAQDVIVRLWIPEKLDSTTLSPRKHDA
jgi:hypothetical protein